MIPLWTKDRDGKWVEFPYEVLETLPNGKMGFHSFDPGINNAARDKMLHFLEKVDYDLHQFFNYDVTMSAYVLKEKAGEDK